VEVHGYNIAILVSVDVVVIPNVDDLEVLVLDVLPQLHKAVLQLVLLPLDE
jgi:hypothetical protein